MTRFIIKVNDGEADRLKFDLENNYVFIGAVWSDKSEVVDFKEVTSQLIDRTTNRVMAIVTEGMYGETQLAALRPEVRKAIREMIFRTEEEVT
jgi:hypothetical protein